MVNPFDVPGRPHSWAGALCPWRYSEHEDWYVDVDSTGEAFIKFTRQIVPFEDLRNTGRLIVVTGDTGCGKTSLVNRCVERVNTAMNRSGSKCDRYAADDFIIDLGDPGFYPEEVETDESKRINTVISAVLRHLKRRNRIPGPADWLNEIDRCSYGELYERLSDAAECHDVALIIILPSVSDYDHELKRYAYLAKRNPRIVFFTETSDRNQIEEYLRRDAESQQIIWLEVDSINDDDGLLLAKSRLRRYPADTVTQIDEKDFQKAVQGINNRSGLSIRRLCQILHTIWERRDDSSLRGLVGAHDVWQTWADAEFQRRPRPPVRT